MRHASPTVPCPAKLSFKEEGGKRHFSNRQKVRVVSPQKPLLTSQLKAYFRKKKLLSKLKSERPGAAVRCTTGGARNARLTRSSACLWRLLPLRVMLFPQTCFRRVCTHVCTCLSVLRSLSETPPRLPLKNSVNPESKRGSPFTWTPRKFTGKLVVRV